MMVHLKNIGAGMRTTSLAVDPSDTVLHVLDYFRETEGIPCSRGCHVTFAGQRLSEDRTLSDYNISADNTLQVLLRGMCSCLPYAHMQVLVVGTLLFLRCAYVVVHFTC